MSKTKRRVVCLVVATVFLLATVAKHLFNGFGDGMYALYNMPQSRSTADARQQGTLAGRFKIDPAVLSKDGLRYEFGEAWMEAGYLPRHVLVWYSYSARAGWSYLCIRPRTSWYHDTFSFSLEPSYQPEFQLEGFGIHRLGGMEQTSGNGSPELHFQQVPNELNGLTIKVSVYTYSTGQAHTIGTVRLTRIE